MCDFSITKVVSLLLLPVPHKRKGASHARDMVPAKDSRAGIPHVSSPSLEMAFHAGVRVRVEMEEDGLSALTFSELYRLHTA